MKHSVYLFSIYFSIQALSTTITGSAQKCLFSYISNKNEIKLDDIKNDKIQSKLANNYALDFINLFSVIEENYAPLVFKTKYQNLDWQQIKKSTLVAAKKATSEFDIFKLYSELLFKFNDAHVSIQGPSSLTWQIPLQLDYVQGKYLINFIAKDFPNNQKLPNIGDEVVSINGLPIEEFRNQFPYFNSHANPLTNKRLFAVTFSNWTELTGLPLSFMNLEKLDLEIASENKGRSIVSIPIKKEGVGLKQLFDIKDRPASELKALPLLASKLETEPPAISLIESEFEKFDPENYKTLKNILKMTKMMSPAMNKLLMEKSNDKNDSNNNSKDIGERVHIGSQEPTFELPKDFKKIETKNLLLRIPILKDFIGTNFFYAGTFMRNNKRVGYLRIPSYAPSLIITILPFLRYTIHELEKKSDFLIIDQANNPGGYVILSDWMIHALTGKFDSSKHLKFAAKPSISFMRSYAEILNQIAEIKDIDQNLQKELIKRASVELEKIRTAYKNQNNLTEPLDMTIMSDYSKIVLDQFFVNKEATSSLNINKWAINLLFGMDITKDYFYSKPVYFLTNELDFSGGDATPASLQDYGRVKIIGTRTAGAGGTVEEFQMKSFLDSTIHLTTSLMVRSNGQLVENYGVTPDFVIERTKTDLLNKNKDLFNKMLKFIEADLSN